MMTDEIRDLKVTTLAENSVVPPYLGQWGLSLLLELVDADGERRKVVFDTGIHRESLFHNVKEMKVDLGDVDCLAFSHGRARCAFRMKKGSATDLFLTGKL